MSVLVCRTERAQTGFDFAFWTQSRLVTSLDRSGTQSSRRADRASKLANLGRVSWQLCVAAEIRDRPALSRIQTRRHPQLKTCSRRTPCEPHQTLRLLPMELR